ncbi:hypothetical protein BH11MYX1_BH11MYX1_18370 [soil metagenome]
MGLVMFASLVTFQLAVHVVTDGDTPAQTPEWIATQVARANQDFAAVDASFELVASETLPARDAHIVTRADRDGFEALVTDNRIHVFVITKLENVDDPEVPVHGVTWHARHSKYIIIAADSMEGVLAHELGHVFGLPHSTYKISLMNKTKRDDPPPAQRRFADQELAAMKPVVTKLAKVLAIKPGGEAAATKR